MSSKSSSVSFQPGDIESLVAISRRYGADPEFCLAGGGNTSLKSGGRLLVKASGFALATITIEGFVEMDRRALADLLASELPAEPNAREEAFKRAVLAARTQPEKGQRPSVECVLHNLLPRPLVAHSHSTYVNMITCAEGGEAIARKVFGDDVLWVPYVDPGYILARTLDQLLKQYAQRTGRDCPDAVFMQNHGLIVCGKSAAQIERQTDQIIGKIQRHLATTAEASPSAPAAEPFGPVTKLDPAAARSLVMKIAPALRGLLAGSDTLKMVTFRDSSEVLDLVGSDQGKAIVDGGPLTPDQIVYCRSFPLWFEASKSEAAGDLVERLRKAIDEHRSRRGAPPGIVLVRGLGMFSEGDDFASADTAGRVYLDAIKVMAGAQRLGGVNRLSKAQYRFIEEWEVESYRKKISASAATAGRAAGKVALVTGAAQGFGFEIARDLAIQGAHVAMADVNIEGVKQAAGQIAATAGAGKTIALAVNVTDGASVEEAVYQAVRRFGGFDLLVSNAGVLRAGSVKTQAERDFDLVTAVNYKGYFVCVQKASPIMAMQHIARRDYWSDVIQINSKSGLQGSNRNGAYAGSKFGGIGLTQSFALELVEDGIKVNSICPGNFFDGPLWSDPKDGLFAQYLRSGKVPGAKTIQDVKKAYESKVPMGRGCSTADVMKAIYYLMDQKFETGQALPVSGGQVMLS
jgi:rhamnose utilization protein RhaD (predicted bifunctional aldolase and dehydrogenase)/NAD(P)-dependent dehydrogenase (short-subunit alcohol dehydrogenase family)